MVLNYLYWLLIIFSFIGWLVPGPTPQPWGFPRLAGGATFILFVIIGLRHFPVSLA
jgi:hypothetical protein